MKARIRRAGAVMWYACVFALIVLGYLVWAADQVARRLAIVLDDDHRVLPD